MTDFINTLFIGKVLHEFDALASTNTYAKELLSQSAPPEGTTIWTHDQYAGKGQATNSWESAPRQNLTFTTILYPKFLAARNQFLLNQVVSLSVFDALNKYLGMGLTIKWPNDLYVFDKKITGILIQNNLQGSNIQSSIIGIGINVNQKVFVSDAPNPTSIAIETGKTTVLADVLANICQFLEKYYLQLRAGQIQLLQERYHNHLFRFQEDTFYSYPDGTVFKGKIIGTSPIGKLLVETGKRVESFGLKELKYLF
ncbi:MAG: biotin--[acetyl-CoA-carboxylase] ligase [Bacteroidota bacterium]